MIDLMHIFNVSFRLAFLGFNIYNDLTDANLDLNMHGDLFAFRPSATRTGIARAEPSREILLVPAPTGIAEPRGAISLSYAPPNCRLRRRQELPATCTAQAHSGVLMS